MGREGARVGEGRASEAGCCHLFLFVWNEAGQVATKRALSQSALTHSVPVKPRPLKEFQLFHLFSFCFFSTRKVVAGESGENVEKAPTHSARCGIDFPSLKQLRSCPSVALARGGGDGGEGVGGGGVHGAVGLWCCSLGWVGLTVCTQSICRPAH